MDEAQKQAMAEAVARIRENMTTAAKAAGRDPGEVLLCAACKTRTVEEVRYSADLPIDLFGENHVQELVEKTDAGAYNGKPGHFIGHLQTNKHFLNTVCTHIVDIDYGKIKMYVGNYDFWYESSQLIQQLIRNKNKRAEEKIAELQTFIARFAANKAKSKQATSRRRLLDKMTVEEMPASSRRYPFVGFEREREVGKDILFVTDVSKTIDGVKLLDKVSFIVNKNDKIAFVGENELAQTTLFKILMGELEPDEGSVKWGQTVTTSYLPKDNTAYFEGCSDSLVDWIRQYSAKKDDVYLRGFLGRMLFSGEEPRAKRRAFK